MYWRAPLSLPESSRVLVLSVLRLALHMCTGITTWSMVACSVVQQAFKVCVGHKCLLVCRSHAGEFLTCNAWVREIVGALFGFFKSCIVTLKIAHHGSSMYTIKMGRNTPSTAFCGSCLYMLTQTAFYSVIIYTVYAHVSTWYTLSCVGVSYAASTSCTNRFTCYIMYDADDCNFFLPL